MEYPTALYPSAPKLEHFMKAPTQMHTVSSGTEGVSSSYTKMSKFEYEAYLESHRSWLKMVEEVQHRQHDLAVVRRARESYREVGDGFVDQRRVSLPSNSDKFVIKTEKKVKHEPTLSTKPHRSEKRVERKKLDNQRQVVAVEVLKAKNEALVQTLPDKKEAVTFAEIQRTNSKNAASNLLGAKSLAPLVSVLKETSPDDVASVAQDAVGRWSVVTRKKGRFMPVMAEIGETVADGKSVWQVSKDPVGALSLLPKTAVRRPNQVDK